MTPTGDARLQGHVHVRQGERTLIADEISYTAATRDFDAKGAVELTDPQLHVRGENAAVNGDGSGEFTSTTFDLPARSARGTADRIVLKPEGELNLQGVTYTSCPPGSQDWLLRAASIDIDRDARTGTGRDVRLDFKGVPIFYTPFISFPVGNERKSGFLFPNLGVSSRSGTLVAVPWYWNIAPDYDATLTPMLYTSRGVALDTEFRYLTDSSRGQLQANYLPNDRDANMDRSYVRFTDRTNLTSHLRFDTDATNVSDQHWFEDFGLGSEGTSTTYLDRFAQLTYLTDEWRIIGRAQNLQLIDPAFQTDPQLRPLRPYTLLPQVAAHGFMPDRAYGLTWTFDGELTSFDREDGITGQRLSVEPEVSLPLRRGGLYLVPAAGWQYTTYRLSHTPATQDSTPSINAEVLSVDTGMVLERSSGSQGQRLQTLEPRMLYLYVPRRNQDDIPIFDTTIPDLNLVQLFRKNRYVGLDRLSDANQLAVGVTTRLLDSASGRQFLAATLGQAVYFTSPSVRLPREAPASRTTSDIVGEAELTAYKNWNAHVGIQWNPHERRAERGEVRFQYIPAPDHVINVGYRYRRDALTGVTQLDSNGNPVVTTPISTDTTAARLEQVDTSFAWPIASNWDGYGRVVYSLQDHQPIERFVGFQYRSCCWSLRFVGGRSVSTRTGQSDTSVRLQLELNGLSSVGVPVDTFLARSIRGYSARQTTSPSP
jgi:LPS-assembly protein